MAKVRTNAADRDAQIRTAALLALAAVGKKDSNRKLLQGGQAFDVEGVFNGQVDGHDVNIDVGGQLRIGHDGTRSSTHSPDLPTLLALILEKVPKTRRADILDLLPQDFSELQQLPDADPDLVAAADTLLKSLRSRSVSKTTGSIHFERSV